MTHYILTTQILFACQSVVAANECWSNRHSRSARWWGRLAGLFLRLLVIGWAWTLH
jgi:hypothetical protein